MKKIFLVVLLVLLFAFLPALAEEQKTQQTGEKSGSEEVVTKTYTLRYVTPKFINDSLRIYLRNCSYGEGSNLISVILYKKDIATFEEQLRKLDIEKKIIRLRIFTVIASKEGKSDAIENKDLKRVLAEVSYLLNFKSYVLDGASVITLEDGARFGRLLLSSATIENLGLDFERVSISTDSEGKFGDRDRREWLSAGWSLAYRQRGQVAGAGDQRRDKVKKTEGTVSTVRQQLVDKNSGKAYISSSIRKFLQRSNAGS
ncbi:MAG: hypothetical protein NTZ12_11655 [Candidatus Aminicenantes bacterium]|nr:hypothetical protein [Candidatus Aminicenantes bacterium]